MSIKALFSSKSTPLIWLAMFSSSAIAADAPEVSEPMNIPVQVTSAPIISASTNNAEILRQQRQDLAIKKINVFRSAVRNSTVTKGFFSRFTTSAISPIDAELLRDMNQFTLQFIAMPETAEVFHLKAIIQQRNENYPAAALNWVLIQALYPNSPFAIDAAKQLKELSSGALDEQRVLLTNMTKTIPTLQGDHDQRLADFLQYLGKLSDAKFAPAIMAEAAAFLVSNQSFLREDLIEHAIARQAMLVDNQVASYHFNRLLTFYPDSPLRPDSLWSLGTLQRKGMKQFDLAIQSYSKLIEQYPDSGEAKFAIEALAQLYAEDLNDYPNALKTNQAIVEKYGTDPVVLRSMQNIALIYQNKVNEPAKAIESYLKIAAIFKGGEALDALIKAEKIAAGVTKNWKQAIDINNQIIGLVPSTEEAAKALFANGDMAENRLGDKELAKKYYADLVSRHPTHPLAKNANDRLTALTPPIESNQKSTPFAK